MNERIKQLAEQAREFATTRHPVSNIVLSVNSEKFEEKFAELIVQECMHMCDVAQWGCITHGWDKQAQVFKSAQQYIAEHFGVEE